MRSIVLATLSLLLAAAPLTAAHKAAPAETLRSPVIRLAPDFSLPGIGNKRTLRSLHGQPVVLVIAASPKTKLFRKQLERLKHKYSRFASEQVIFVAAFRQGDGPVNSDVPFSVAFNGPAVADAYGVTKDFSIAVIGRDGNLDCQTSQPLTAERIIDVVQNSFVPQSQTRKTFVQ